MALPPHLPLAPDRRAPAALPEVLRLPGAAPMTTCTAVRHGTLTAYWHDDCRCPEASAKASRRQKEYRAGVRRRVSGIGASRRLKALAVIGYTQVDIASRLGWVQREISQLVVGRSLIGAAKAARIAALYDALKNTAGPSPRAGKYAAARGWLSPAWWDDDTIDDPAYDPVLEHEITRAELDAQEQAHLLLEVQRLTDAGLGADEIGRRIGMTGRTVTRYRAAWQEAS